MSWAEDNCIDIYDDADFVEKYIDVQLKCIIAETDKAYKVVIDDNNTIWLPKSKIRCNFMLKVGDVDVIIQIPKWLYKRNKKVKK